MGKVYKYTSNKDPRDGTEEIRLPGRDPVPMGGEVELSEDEHESLKGRLNLRVVDKDSENEDEVSWTDKPQGEDSPDKN